MNSVVSLARLFTEKPRYLTSKSKSWNSLYPEAVDDEYFTCIRLVAVGLDSGGDEEAVSAFTAKGTGRRLNAGQVDAL